jgi:methylaspartate ammonia-lyase
MTVSRHVEKAAEKLQEAARQIALAREGPNDFQNQRAWLEALTSYCEALADIHAYNNESIHEKLHALAGRAGLRKFPPSS